MKPVVRVKIEDSSKYKWNTIQPVGDTLGPLPKHGSLIFFEYCGEYCAGVFLNDIHPSSDPEEDYAGDFGFFGNNDEFYEVEYVTKWMYVPE